MRFFNTEGPNRPDDHYTLPPLSRWDLDEILRLIDQKKRFLLHASRRPAGWSFGSAADRGQHRQRGNDEPHCRRIHVVLT